MNKILQEPLLHFLILGLGLYLTSMLVDGDKQAVQTIVVSEGKIKQLTTMYQKTWQRSPSRKELTNIVQEYVLEQAAYYEGVKLGLDRNDIVIMRRVRQKLDFIAEESKPRPSPTDDLLQKYLQTHPEKFALESRYTLRHIFFDINKHGDSVFTQAKLTLAELKANPEKNVNALGDRYLFKPYYKELTLTDLSRTFGQYFIQKITALSAGKWHVPIRSDFGSHLIYIEKKQGSALPKLIDIRQVVLREWEHDLRKQSTTDFYQNLLAKYQVTINWPTKKKVVNH